MDEADAADALAALGHEARLRVFRLLVRAGEGGLSVGDIAAHAGLAPSTLAHHLGALEAAGLARRERAGRLVLVRADYDRMRAVLAFVAEACCAGVRLTQDDAA